MDGRGLEVIGSIALLEDELVILLLGDEDEMVEDLTGVITIPDEDDRGCDPGEDIVETDGNVLSVGLVEDPDLTGRGRFGDTVTVIVDETTIEPGVLPKTE